MMKRVGGWLAVAAIVISLPATALAQRSAAPKPTLIRLINKSPRLTADDLDWMAEALTAQLNADYRAYYHKRKPILVVVGGKKGFPVTLTDNINAKGGIGTAEGLNRPHRWAMAEVQGFQGFADGPKPMVDWPALSATTAIADHEIEEALTGKQIADAWEGWAYYVDGLQMADFALPRKAARTTGAAHFCGVASYCWAQ